MTRALTRKNFHNSPLMRALCDLAIVEPVAPATGFAAKMGTWLSLHDTIALYGVHSASAANPAPLPLGTRLGQRTALDEVLTQVRTSLVDLIHTNTACDLVRARLELQPAKSGAPMDQAPAYESYRRYYVGQQRDIEFKIRPLRTQVRAVLASTSPKLSQLAALDAVLDDILSERESKLFTTVPALLEKRFKQLFKAHQQLVTQADTPLDAWQRPGGWLAIFCQDMETALLAELDTRLQPTLGLTEAFNNDISQINE